MKKLLKTLFWAFVFIMAFVAFNQRFNEGWDDSIHNPNNQPLVLKCAFNLGIHPDSVTQSQFNARYLK